MNTDKKAEVKLKIVESLQDDAYKGIARIDSEAMRTLGIKRGDVISIKGSRETIAIADKAYPADVGEGTIRIDGILRRNARAGIGDLVSISKAEIKEAKKVMIAPGQKGIMVQGDPESLKRGLLGRAVLKGDILVLGGVQRKRRDVFSEMGMDDELGGLFGDMLSNMGMGNLGGGGLTQIKFVVVSTNPNQPCVITENTEVSLNSTAVEVTDEKVPEIPEITYEDIGGLSEEIKKIREMVEIPLKHPEIFEKLGIDPPKGVLLHGPPGTGKTLLAKAVANESEANFILLNGPEIMSKFYGESEKKIRDIFEEAEKSAPSIIFIDEIDAIAPKREEVTGEVERRVVSQLLTMMDGLKSRGKVVVIGATNRVNALDSALRRPGRFDREIIINVPDKGGRKTILDIHSRGMPIKAPFVLGLASKFVDERMNEIEESKPEKKIVFLREEIETLNKEITKTQKEINLKDEEIGEVKLNLGKVKLDFDKLQNKRKELVKKLRLSESQEAYDRESQVLLNLERQSSLLERQNSILENNLRSLENNKDSKEKIVKSDKKLIARKQVDIKEFNRQLSLVDKLKKLNKLPERTLDKSLFGLEEKDIKKIKDIWKKIISLKEKGNFNENEVFDYFCGEPVYESGDPRLKILENYSKQFILTKPFVEKNILPQLDKKEDSELILHLESLIKNYSDDDLTQELFSNYVDDNFKNELKKRFLEKMKEEIAAVTHGFVGADLSALTKEAAMNVLRKILPKMNLDAEELIPPEILEELIIENGDFISALKVVRPSAMREVLVETPNITWESVGGLVKVKQELKEAVEWPLKHPEAFERLGIKPSKGILLYGPPGTGKTLLAKAVAKESEANFIQIKGPSLLSMWVGKSEEGVRKIFERARQVAPCVIFFDEMDSLAGRRGQESGTKVTERVLNQLLAEMDGLEDLKDILIIGATNRPDMLDPAILRPGRFDKILLINAPEEEGREQILDIHTKKMPIELSKEEVKEIEKELTGHGKINFESKMVSDESVKQEDLNRPKKKVDYKNLTDREKLCYYLAKKTEGYTGADLEGFAREAALLALRDSMEAKNVKKKHFEEALKKIKPSVSKSTTDSYRKIEEHFIKSVKAGLNEGNSYLG